MTNSPIHLQDLRRRVYVKTKAEPPWRLQCRGFGWKRWSRRRLNQVDVESGPSAIGPITLGEKCAGKRSAGNPHAAFDVAGAGNGATASRTEAWFSKGDCRSHRKPVATAPVLDPTGPPCDHRRSITNRYLFSLMW